MDEHLSLQYLIQARLIDKIEIRDGGALVYINNRKTKKTPLKKKGTNQRKSSDHKHEYRLIGAEHVKGRKGDFQVINLDLNSYLVSPFLLGKGGHRTTPPK